MSGRIQMTTRTVVIFSGGLDSTTLLYDLQATGDDVAALAINYGQRHSRELFCAQKICQEIGVDLTTLDLSGLAQIFGRNSLSDTSVAVPEGQYAEDSMQQTTVPNRNMILLSVATGWAISNGYQAVTFGAHSGEYTPYPDCRPEFATAMDNAAQLCDWQPIRILAPFVTWTKSDIVRRGAELGVPFQSTWSCYVGGEKHCGRCGTCLDRKSAFEKSGIADPTDYESD
jgi:7-cyano-7-deazaguanine synthase